MNSGWVHGTDSIQSKLGGDVCVPYVPGEAKCFAWIRSRLSKHTHTSTSYDCEYKRDGKGILPRFMVVFSNTNADVSVLKRQVDKQPTGRTKMIRGQ